MEPGYGRRSTDVAFGRDGSADHAAAGIAVDLLGGLRVRSGGTTISPRDLGGSRARLILIALLLHRGAPLSKGRLVALLWGESPPSGASATIESYICILRQRLQPGQQRQSSVITTQAGCYRIDMSRVELDVVRYESLMSAALRPDILATDALPMLERAMTLAESPLLPEEIDCQWLDELRIIHNHKVHKDQIAAAKKVAGSYPDSAQRWARLALEGDPLDESAWFSLLQSMEASGQHAQGLREYDRCRRLLSAELGCTPGPGLQDLYVRLLRGTNEDNDQLSLLFDAVIRLHTASQLSAPPTVGRETTKRYDADDQAISIRQARRTLDLLLSKIGGIRQDLGFALEA